MEVDQVRRILEAANDYGLRAVTECAMKDGRPKQTPETSADHGAEVNRLLQVKSS
jgi:hypothetical protein